jgi:branched-chain amino acid transport system ATP-binding protein
MAPLLKLVNVTKRFGGIVAVDRVSLEVERGELVGIIGPNGSGKTTLFNLINGVYAPDEGRIYFEGTDVTDLPPYVRARMGIARTFQIPRPWGALSVRENVAIGAMFGYQGRGFLAHQALEEADDVLRLVGLYHKRFEPAYKLTVPEKKLLELARALAMKPKLLLLDEVVAGLSPTEVERVVSVVKRVRDELGISVVALVEHVMKAVVSFAERLIVMDRGRVVLDGPLEEVVKSPKLAEIYLGEEGARIIQHLLGGAR